MTLVAAETQVPVKSVSTGSRSLEALNQAAQNGDSNAQFELGLRLWKSGKADDRHNAYNFFRQAALQRHVVAQKVFGVCTREGLRPNCIPTEILDQINTPEPQNDREEEYNVIWRLVQNTSDSPSTFAQAVEKLQKAAESGHVLSMCRMGMVFEEYWFRCLNTSLAVHWYEQAASRGNTVAQEKLGAIFLYGKGVPSDPAKAVQWYRASFEQHASIQSAARLGECLLDGIGTLRDESEAFKLLSYAASTKWHEPFAGLGDCYLRGAGVKKDLAKGIACYSMAATNGYIPGLIKLAKCYVDGIGVEQDYPTAFFYLERAVRGGSKEAEQLADQLLERTLEKK